MNIIIEPILIVSSAVLFLQVVLIFICILGNKSGNIADKLKALDKLTEIKEGTDKITTIQVEVNKMSPLKSVTDKIVTQVENIKIELAKISNISAETNKISSIIQDIANLTSAVSDIKTSLTTISSSVVNISSAIVTTEGEKVSTNIKAIKSDVEVVKTKVSAIKNAKSEAVSYLSGLSTEKASFINKTNLSKSLTDLVTLENFYSTKLLKLFASGKMLENYYSIKEGDSKNTSFSTQVIKFLKDRMVTLNAASELTHHITNTITEKFGTFYGKCHPESNKQINRLFDKSLSFTAEPGIVDAMLKLNNSLKNTLILSPSATESKLDSPVIAEYELKRKIEYLNPNNFIPLTILNTKFVTHSTLKFFELEIGKAYSFLLQDDAIQPGEGTLFVAISGKGVLLQLSAAKVVFVDGAENNTTIHTKHKEIVDSFFDVYKTVQLAQMQFFGHYSNSIEGSTIQTYDTKNNQFAPNFIIKHNELAVPSSVFAFNAFDGLTVENQDGLCTKIEERLKNYSAFTSIAL